MVHSRRLVVCGWWLVVMRVRLDYGTEGLEVDLPDERVTIIEPIPRAAATDPHATLLSAMRAPLDRPPLGELVRTGQRVAISVCDITRAQPRRDMLRALFEEMPQVRPEDVTILIATGTHRINTPPELERMLGRDILRRYRVINHDSRDPSSLGRVGVTSTGVEVFLNTACRLTAALGKEIWVKTIYGAQKTKSSSSTWEKIDTEFPSLHALPTMALRST